jgi:putative spermidine/putrescine transport system substrate-binding protein
MVMGASWVRLMAIRTGPAAVAVALLLVGLPGSARAQTKDVYFLTWGGTIQAMLERDGWAKRFTEDTGYNVILVPKATGPEIIATAIAQKAVPQVDVVMTDMLPFLTGIHQGIFASLDANAVPHMGDLYDGARIKDPETGAIIGLITYGDIFCIIYNEDVFQRKGWTPPRSWADIARPEFKGQLLLAPGNTTYGLYNLVIQAHAHSGSERDIEPGFQTLKQVAPGVVDWSNTFAKMSEFLQAETASVAVYTTPAAVDMRQRGIHVDYVIPDPVYMSPTAAGVMEHAPNPAGARAFLNWWISAKVLKYRAETYGQSPMNRTVELSPEAAVRVPHGRQLDELATIDYDYVNAHRAEWSQRFDKEIAPLH